MPKNEIDYSNTIIYKITCSDPNITDVYVGHTTNFVQRKHAHKASCLNEKSANYKCKLYETIRCNGGWCNWKMEIVNFFNCANHYEARQKEQEYFTLLKANLNSIEPLPKTKIKTLVTPKEKKEKHQIYCQTCNVYFQNIPLLEIHNNTKKHIKLCNPNNLFLKKEQKKIKFLCLGCNFKTSNKKDYSRHILTSKHLEMAKKMTQETKIPKKKKYLCVCGNVYTYNSGLTRHKQKCKQLLDKNTEEPESNINLTKHDNLIQYLMKENFEFKSLIMELVKNDNTHLT
jgi:hypothetical protein